MELFLERVILPPLFEHVRFYITPVQIRVLYSAHYNDTARASEKYFYYAQNPDDATQKPIAFRNETVTYHRIRKQ